MSAPSAERSILRITRMFQLALGGIVHGRAGRLQHTMSSSQDLGRTMLGGLTPHLLVSTTVLATLYCSCHDGQAATHFVSIERLLSHSPTPTPTSTQNTPYMNRPSLRKTSKMSTFLYLNMQMQRYKIY